MLERSRLVSKKISKTQSVQSQLEKEFADGRRSHRPSDHVRGWRSEVGVHPAGGDVLGRCSVECGVEVGG